MAQGMPQLRGVKWPPKEESQTSNTKREQASDWSPMAIQFSLLKIVTTFRRPKDLSLFGSIDKVSGSLRQEGVQSAKVISKKDGRN